MDSMIIFVSIIGAVLMISIAVSNGLTEIANAIRSLNKELKDE